jgi:hypothetical protein
MDAFVGPAGSLSGLVVDLLHRSLSLMLGLLRSSLGRQPRKELSEHSRSPPRPEVRRRTRDVRSRHSGQWLSAGLARIQLHSRINAQGRNLSTILATPIQLVSSQCSCTASRARMD